MVERRRGAGTFVASPKIHFNKLMSYSEHMSSRGLSPRSRVLVAKIIEHEPEVAARLGLPATSALVKIERLRETGDEPFALETRQRVRRISESSVGESFFVCDIGARLWSGSRLC